MSKQQIIERLEVFKSDPHLVCGRLGLLQDQPNWALIFKSIIDNENVELLERMERELEQWNTEQVQAEAQAVVTKLRSDRDKLLSGSDWTQIADAPVSEEQRAEWVEYRAYLRSVPQLWDDQRMREPVVLKFDQWKLVRNYSN